MYKISLHIVLIPSVHVKKKYLSLDMYIEREFYISLFNRNVYFLRPFLLELLFLLELSEKVFLLKIKIKCHVLLH